MQEGDEDFKGDLRKEFKMSHLGNLSYFLDIECIKSSRDLMMHQIRYISEIIKRFKMEEFNATSTPVEPRLQLLKNSNKDDVDTTQYKRLIGSLR